LNCFEKPYQFGIDHARFVFFRQKEPNLHYVPQEEFSCNVTLLSGLPGSGKDSWLKKHRNDLPILSLDDVRKELDIAPTDNQGKVAQLAKERRREHLRNRVPFAFNAINTMKLTRTRWIDLFADYNARIEIVYVEGRRSNEDSSRFGSSLQINGIWVDNAYSSQLWTT